MSNNIRKVRMEKGLSLRELGERIDMHFTNLGKIERGERSPNLDLITKIARALEVEPGALVGELARDTVRMVPLVGRVAAGNWREAILDPIGYVPAPTGGPNSFGLQPDGSSMNRAFLEGAYVIVDPDDTALIDGRVYAIKNDEEETTVKRFRSDPARLEPDSDDPSHQPIMLGGAPFSVIGRVIWQVRPV